MAAFLMAVAFVGLLQLHNYSLTIAGKAKEFNTAARDASDMMEKISAVDFASVLSRFPNNCCVGTCGTAPACPGASDIVVASEMILQNERIDISYPAGTGGDPLGIRVTASWTGRDGREHRSGGDAPPVDMITIKTKT